MSLFNSTMSYPTWNCINQKLDINYQGLLFGSNPLKSQKEYEYHSSFSFNSNDQCCGIDIPVLIEPYVMPRNTKLVFIVGESPLRNDKAIMNCNYPENNVILGTPFAVHLPSGNPSQCDVYKNILNGILNAGYSVYLTDIVKKWFKNTKLKAKDKDLDIQIIENEIAILKDQIGYHEIRFVTWGNYASEMLKKKLNKKPNKDFLELPHPSKNNRNNWKLRIYEKAIYSKGIRYATKIYPNPNSCTSENIVVNEAIADILDFVK